MPARLRLYLMALAAVTLWGASFPLTKVALDTVGPTSLAFLRWAISAAALAGWLAWKNGRGIPAVAPPENDASTLSSTTEQPERVNGATSATVKKLHPRLSALICFLFVDGGAQTFIARMLGQDWRAVAWVALSGITLFYWLENTALRYTTATNAGVLSNLTAVFMALIAVVTLGERPRAREWGAMAVAFGGAVLISQGAGHLTVGRGGVIGDLLMIAASLFAAIYSIGGKRLSEKYPAVAVTTVVATVGAVLLLPLALLEGLRLDLPLKTWGAVLMLGLGAGALANVWWLAILARMPASRAALALFLIPLVSAALAVTLLGEPLTPVIVLGGLLVLSGVMIVQTGKNGSAA